VKQSREKEDSVQPDLWDPFQEVSCMFLYISVLVSFKAQERAEASGVQGL
jgi:hypothetical protein